jgi:hypothetical protein
MTVTNTATDSDVPPNPMGYQLSGPIGASIDTSGVIRWTPAYGQVPSTNVFTTVVTDTNVNAVNAQNLSATNSFTVTVQAIHNGPSLPAQTNLTVNELILLTVTNTATDSDVPLLPLGYTLWVTNLADGSLVTNALIDTNGVITWTPTEGQGPGTNVFVTLVSDGGLSATNSFQVVVNEVNSAPLLPVQNDVTLVGLQGMTVTNTATDGDVPPNPLGYQLSGPAGASIDANGIISWTPGYSQVPSTNVFTTVVTDTNIDAVNAQNLSVTNTFTVTVQAVYNHLVLPQQPNRALRKHDHLEVTNTAVAVDVPPLSLTYSLTATNVPTGDVVTNATIDNNGLITWIPLPSQDPSTNAFTTVVTDGSAAATNSFLVIVSDLEGPPVAQNDSYSMKSGDTLTVPAPGVLINDNDPDGEPLSVVLISGPANGLFNLNTDGGFSYTPTNGFSGTDAFTYQATDGIINSDTTTVTIIVSYQLQIVSIELIDGVATVSWISLPDSIYRLQFKNDISYTNWSDVTPDVTATGTISSATNTTSDAMQQFYRVFLVK